MIRNDQVVPAMVLYGLGFMAMFALLGVLYATAWRRCRRAGAAARAADALEGIGHCAIHVLVALISIAVVLIGGGRAALASGLCYTLNAPLHVILRKIARQRR